MSISPELTRFILTSVPSIPFLEAALLLRRDPAVAWSAEQVARALYIASARAELLLRDLEAAGVARPADPGRVSWHFAADDETVARAYAELETAYRVEMVAVTNLVHDSTRRSAQRFADAFKLRKDP